MNQVVDWLLHSYCEKNMFWKKKERNLLFLCSLRKKYKIWLLKKNTFHEESSFCIEQAFEKFEYMDSGLKRI